MHATWVLDNAEDIKLHYALKNISPIVNEGHNHCKAPSMLGKAACL